MEKVAYHHGALRQALIATAVELARKSGPDGVVLRETARMVGVSATAAYRHFQDREDLLAAVRGAASLLLAEHMLRGLHVEQDPLLRFRHLGAAYIQFALDEPGLLRTLATGQWSPPADHDRPYPPALLMQAVDEVAATGQLGEPDHDHAAAVAWAAVHGLSVLLLEQRLEAQQAAALTDKTLHMVAFGLVRGRNVNGR